MPTYDYECRKCGHRFEVFHSMSDDTARRCPKCKSKARRVPSAGAGLLFKGSGFYITDYRSSSYKEKAKQEKSAGKGESKSGGDSGSKSGGNSGSKSGGGSSGGSQPSS